VGEPSFNHPFIILMVGVVIVLAILIRTAFERLSLPPLTGFIALGFLMRCLEYRLGIFSAGAWHVFQLLAAIGVITLLFRIGLESNIAGLLHQLRRASFIWVGDVLLSGGLLSGGLGYAVSYFLLGWEFIPSLFVAAALTATSVGISVGVWQNADALQSPTGELLIDVAEMDDVSGIVLMALLFALAPVLKNGASASLAPLVLETGGILLLKLLVFGAFCVVFSQYIEDYVTRWFERIAQPPVSMLVVAGLGFIMVAFAGLIGFSSAIGAFFAGLVFSRDPESVKLEAAFGPVYELFSPFFFIGIGLHIDPAVIGPGLAVGGILLVVAVLGKVLGDGLGALVSLGWAGAVLLGLTMVPRAEIAMVIMNKGLELGPWAVPSEVYAGMVVVSLGTCVFSALTVRALLQRWPQEQTAG
jgi:Kef-type K+ transport system membrane component KefB